MLYVIFTLRKSCGIESEEYWTYVVMRENHESMEVLAGGVEPIFRNVICSFDRVVFAKELKTRVKEIVTTLALHTYEEIAPWLPPLVFEFIAIPNIRKADGVKYWRISFPTLISVIFALEVEHDSIDPSNWMKYPIDIAVQYCA